MLRQLREKVEKTCHINHLYYYLTNKVFVYINASNTATFFRHVLRNDIWVRSFFKKKHITKKYLVIDIFKYIYVLLKSL